MDSILITGGAGFIGANAAHYFSKKGWQVTILDDLSRFGAELNMAWLQEHASIQFEKADIRDQAAVQNLIQTHKPHVVLHLAGQVAVTSSVKNPREDFLINAMGTLNVLESIRKCSPDTFFINASTNKIYGKMEELRVRELESRYEYETLKNGVDENRPLDPHSPYGCSKGAADQYSIDYARIYGLHTISLRQSCIYGPRQFGVEDQGWVAWFIIAAVIDKPITVYGNGKQVRDILQVEDLVRAYECAIDHCDSISGQVFNIGGGPGSTLSLLELIDYLQQILEKKIDPAWDDWRAGDQSVFVCDINKAAECMGWRPSITVDEGIRNLIDWVRENKDLFQFD